MMDVLIVMIVGIVVERESELYEYVGVCSMGMLCVNMY